jgi:hypothetical protein
MHVLYGFKGHLTLDARLGIHAVNTDFVAIEYLEELLNNYML